MTTAGKPLISKSRYMSGLQCDKLLWCHYNAKEVFPPVPPARQAIFDQGHRVGELATELFPGGILVDPEGYTADEVIPATGKVLENRVPLFEAGFVHGRAYVRVDILDPAEDGAWDLYEVKSSTSVKEEHLPDVAFQRYVLEGSGVRVNRCSLVHLNNRYVRRGELDLKELFTVEDASAAITGPAADIEARLERMISVVQEPDMPAVSIGPQCTSPYECALIPFCWAFLPQRDVTTLYMGKRRGFELLEMGIERMQDIPEGFPLTWKQGIQVQAVRDGEPHVDQKALDRFLASLRYPVHYLDFETVMPAVPLFSGTRPYEQIPFQFSCHVVRRPGDEPEHARFLARNADDPRPAFARRLMEAVGEEGSVVVYNAPFERGIIRTLGQAGLLEDDWTENVLDRTVDLLAPFRSFAVYHPDQGGSASMKNVLPALTGRGYDDLAIAEGQTASAEYFRVTYGDVSDEERDSVYHQLTDYCAQDTLGMMHIVDRLAELAGRLRP